MAAAAVGALASLLALLAANGTSQLDCLCSRIHNQSDGGRQYIPSDGETWLWSWYCERNNAEYYLVERCETAEQLSPVLPALSRLWPWNWRYGPPPAGDRLSCGPGGECECGAALAEIRALTWEEAWELLCHISHALNEYWASHGLNDTKWTVETLAEDQKKLSQLLHAAQSIMRAAHSVETCERWRTSIINYSQAELASYLKDISMYLRRNARLLLPIATHVSQLFIPLAFEHMGNHTNGEQLHGWIKNMERVRDMLDTKFMGFVHDAQFLSEQVANYKVEEDKDTPGKYKIRTPLLSDRLLKYQPHFVSFCEDFGAVCEQQLPQAPQVFGLADALYSYYRHYIYFDWGSDYNRLTGKFNIVPLLTVNCILIR